MRFRLRQKVIDFAAFNNFKIRSFTNARKLSVCFSQAPRISILLGLFSLLLALPAPSYAQAKRVVVVKCDGLPYEVVDRFVKERNPRTGKSQLPWFDYLFYQHGTRLANFYVRGISLSGPSWSLIETGQHLQIKGNVEFDRYTLQTYDYLNFIPFYVNSTTGARVDMPGVEVLDSLGVPLLTDAFPYNERFATLSLFQRGPRFVTFHRALENKLKSGPKDLFDEWATGFDIGSSLPDQLVRELIVGIGNPRMRYLQLMLFDFDHRAHHNNDRESQLFTLKQLDATFGRIWTAMQQSPLAEDTALIAVSDHGINSDERVYSQGYNLVNLLGSAAGGGHHVATKRRLLMNYAIKGLSPFAQTIITASRDSYYLKDKSNDYPTALLDFDGNERASVHLRDSDLNLLQILLQQMQRAELSPGLQKALADRFFATLERRRAAWQQDIDQLNEELGALHRGIERQRELCAQQPKKFSQEEAEAGRDDDAKRVCAQLARWLNQERSYGEYARIMTNLLGIQPSGFDAAKLKIEEVIPPHAMGESNNIYRLQNYIAGISPAGLVLDADGALDMSRGFVRIDYFSLLHNQSVRNNVQAQVSNQPVDLVALRIPAELVKPLVHEENLAPDAVWVYEGNDRQALILARDEAGGQLSLRYLPIKNLTQDQNGRIQFEPAEWESGFPLKILEDPQLALPREGRAAWLGQWHTDLEWLQTLHKTKYSNGLIGLYEELAFHPIGRLADEKPATRDERLMLRLVRRQRENSEADMLIVANDHWNFDVRGFNPGGNHGSFFRVSTHSTLMFAGGRKTSIPQGLVVDEPYDSLSFMPTVLALTGNLRDDSNPIPVLWEKGFRRFPGRVVREVMAKPEIQKIAVTGATESP
ncbi:MAG: alkaline phosphatase family protein [Blastocatellia bacterium]|nr:alkaline phosphatase family protein [Blastocatellia bacterium]